MENKTIWFYSWSNGKISEEKCDVILLNGYCSSLEYNVDVCKENKLDTDELSWCDEMIGFVYTERKEIKYIEEKIVKYYETKLKAEFEKYNRIKNNIKSEIKKYK